jgi:hypothetical protein
LRAISSGEICQQIIAERFHVLERQVREFDVAQARRDVQFKMLTISLHCAAFAAVRLDTLDPALPRFQNRLALARRDVQALAHRDLHGRIIGVGVLYRTS